MTGMSGERSPRTRARERDRELGEVPPQERARLAAGFGTLLSIERGARTQFDFARVVGLSVSTIKALESGSRRPTTSSIWRIARAVRSGLRARVALDERLRRAAGPSLRDYGRRPHAARERMRVQLTVEFGDDQPVGEGDTLGALVAADLDAAFRRDAGR